MKFVKLHRDGRELLVNFSLVTEVYPIAGTPSSKLYLIAAEGEQVVIEVSETLDEILEKVKGE